MFKKLRRSSCNCACLYRDAFYSPKLLKNRWPASMAHRRAQHAGGPSVSKLFILDDIVTAKFDRELLKLLAIYRNSNLSAIISIQSPVLLNSATRGNLNYVLLGRMNSDEQIEKVIKMYLTSYIPGRMEDKIKAYRSLTEGYHWIVVENLQGAVYRTKLGL